MTRRRGPGDRDRELARELAETVPEDEAPEDAHRLLHAALAQRFRAMDCDADIIDRGGVFALVGPTGVGKTTTIAKLAARYTLRHGPRKEIGRAHV